MSHSPKQHIKGRGAHVSPNNRFQKQTYSDDDVDQFPFDGEPSNRTRFIEIFPKTIVNQVKSPDVGMDYSLNPYQGCEHGCTYCYARPTHEYWGYSAGLDFEQVILYKSNAPQLLRKALNKKSWKVKPIVLSGNTDCYQPCEKKFELTRQLLAICLEYRNPVGIITKNVLIRRDFDLIAELASLNLIGVNISITTLNEDLRRVLEPRTATSARKLELITDLAALGVPVNVLASPIIPALNDHELLPLAKAVSTAGACNFYAQLVRLMGPNEAIFEDWLSHHFPDRKDKVMNLLKSVHKGKTGSSAFGERAQGTGNYAVNIRRQLEIAKNKYFSNRVSHPLRTDLFRRTTQNGQLDLFG